MNSVKKLASVVGAVAGLAGIALGVQSVSHAQAPAPPAPPFGGQHHGGRGNGGRGNGGRGNRNEQHPELRRALGALNRAEGMLTRAPHDFDGHREKALDLTQQAINEVKQAIQADHK